MCGVYVSVWGVLVCVSVLCVVCMCVYILWGGHRNRSYAKKKGYFGLWLRILSSFLQGKEVGQLFYNILPRLSLPGL